MLSPSLVGLYAHAIQQRDMQVRHGRLSRILDMTPGAKRATAFADQDGRKVVMFVFVAIG